VDWELDPLLAVADLAEAARRVVHRPHTVEPGWIVYHLGLHERLPSVNRKPVAAYLEMTL
jgi:hypothetical protein